MVQLTRDDFPVDSSRTERERVWSSVLAVCSLFDMARDMKILQLRRQYPDAPDTWVINEALRLIEQGCQ